MKVLIPTVGTRGDVQPYITLANELNKSGFTALIATHPCWRELVEGNGIDFSPIGPDINIENEAAAIRESAGHWIIGMIKTMKFTFTIIEGASSQLMELCREADLVAAPHSHMGAAEAEASGVPFISVTIQPDVIPKKLEPQSALQKFNRKAIGLFMNPMMVGPYNKIRRNLGLKPVKTFDELISPKLNIIPASPLVYPVSPYWEDQHKVVGYWFGEEETAYEPPEELERFIQGGPPPVVIALGAMAFESGEERPKLEALVNALKKTGMRAVIQGFHKTLENFTLPDDMIGIGSVPHSWLFRHACCVIHHGGFGTTASVLRAGVPSIVIPHVLDQFFWANKIHGLKAGPKPVSSRNLREQTLVEAITALKKDYEEISRSVKDLSRRINGESGLAKTIELITAVVENREITGEKPRYGK